jgi:anhydro-N-acetylmuramic acid kinase
MSGTSIDAIDCALVATGAAGVELLHTLEHPIPAPVRAQIADLSHGVDDEIERLGVLDRQLGALFAEAAIALLSTSGTAAASIRAIGSHGQTLRHRPPSGGHHRADSFTLQIGDPNTIAELTGITTVADFRRRDIAAGGEGAPLAPAFHRGAFGRQGIARAIINIGGIANATLLDGQRLAAGCDTGPGNTLMDHWIRLHRGVAFDRHGQWAAAGVIDQDLLAKLLEHPFLDLDGPRSTGKEAFNLAWLEGILSGLKPLAPQDVQSTLAEFTAVTIARTVIESDLDISELYVCGGGAHNQHLLTRLAAALPAVAIADTGKLGIDADWVEAVTFAWLAERTIMGFSGNTPKVTGASGERIIGGIYPGTTLPDLGAQTLP